jgi:MoaA/NifB/PqqE/SkfB family radical SAM enzyme
MTAEEFWNSKEMQDLREQHWKGEKPEGCKACWKREDAGLESKRMTDNQRFGHLMHRSGRKVMKKPPAYLDLKLGNICHLKCRICSPRFSSTWAAEDIKFEKNRTLIPAVVYQEKGAWIDNPTFWNWLYSIIDDLEAIDFYGGEPFMTAKHWDFLHDCIRRGIAKNIDIHYNTNGTIFPKDPEIWKEFKSVSIACSIDDIEKRYEYERHPAKWSTTETNAKRFQELEYVNFSICPTVSILNVYYLPELIDWAEQNGMNYYFNMLERPYHFNIRILPEWAKKKIKDKLTRKEFEPVLNLMGEEAAEDAKYFDHFFALNIAEIDKRRGESFIKTFPELYSILKRPPAEPQELFL